MQTIFNRNLYSVVNYSMMRVHRRNSSKGSNAFKRFRTARLRRGDLTSTRSFPDFQTNGETDKTTNGRIWSKKSSSARELNKTKPAQMPEKRIKKDTPANEEKGTKNDDALVFVWRYGDHTFDIPYEVMGEGAEEILFLPTINIASTCTELNPLIQFFASSSKFKTFTLDWPGFGNSSRIDCSYSPPMFLQFLRDFIHQIVTSNSISVVACGHACGYALNLAKTYPDMWNKMIIISPTYQAPVKTLGWHSVSSSLFKSVVRTSILGDYLYQKAIQPANLRKQYESHVFKDKSLVTDDFIRKKYEVVNKSNGRFAPLAFFTGKLDIVNSKEEMAQLLANVQCPLSIVMGENSPPISLTEMQEMTRVPKLAIFRLEGSLGIAEECPRDVAEVLMLFFEMHKT